ncbi:MAG: YggT family protein [Oscillatoria sp. PMC 1051.18]|uniref:YggT family protein n=1 Tax=Oscillatoria salina TaxID=331517 RepID=UPI001CD02358|nr:YggT family protein [Oscillatoria salina]MEC4895586.1 YggT family protein [Oscillatoria sp. PMC 1050.18]MEC5032306.1 YggT family protein [Oscillatoria sp. PMC 1051.18]
MATELLTTSLANFIQLYTILLIVRILLTWFQTMNWANQIAAVLSPVTDPYLNIFRSFIPPLGGALDISPILAILCLQILSSLLISV